MSTKVNLYFQVSLDLELLEKGVHLEVIRLMGEVELEKEDSKWTNPYPAIIDTGAPVSLLPLEVWQECKTKIVVSHSIRGVVPKEECSLPVQVGEVILRLVDEKVATKGFSIMAYLAPTNKVPLILGFKDFLSKLSLYHNFEGKRAFVEF
ncbi:hypothetical protein KJ693_05170 [bacterium]|nr:hypothetical protein [bacterium]MBU1614689.1 hypothetical protein [bacterium]